MKWLKMCFLVILMLLITIESYPQAMLKTSELNEDNSKVNIVDKVYKSKNNYLDINVLVPQINSLSNKEQESVVNNKIIKWTENWINVKKISNGIIYNNLGEMVTGIKIQPKNIFILDGSSMDNTLIGLMNFYNIINI